jgi:hypothetical protein
MPIFALRLLPLALLALCALRPAHADDSAAGRILAGWNTATRVPHSSARDNAYDNADTGREPDLSVYATYKRALMRGLPAGADSGQPDGAQPRTARAATLKLPAGPAADGLKVGLGRALAGGWSVTGAYSRAFGGRRVAMGAPQ